MYLIHNLLRDIFVSAMPHSFKSNDRLILYLQNRAMECTIVQILHKLYMFIIEDDHG